MDVKGTAILVVPLFVRARHGEEGYRQWLKGLSPQARTVYEGVVLATTWFAMKPIMLEPTKLVCDMFYGGSLTGAVELGKYSADHGLKGIYRLFVKLGSPEFIIGKAGAILPTYYKGSAMEAKKVASGKALVRITAFPEPHAIVESRIQGWMMQALTICGVSDVRVRIASSMASGAGTTDFDISWR